MIRQRVPLGTCQLPGVGSLVVADEIRITVCTFQFEIPVVGRQPRVEHCRNEDAPVTEDQPRTSHLNGKVERSHRVDDEEFYQLLDKDGITDDIHLFNEKLREWEDYYNYHRPLGALDGQTPYERMVAKTRAGVLPTS